MEFLKPRFYPVKFKADDLAIIHATGEDVLRFFQGQTSRDLNSLEAGLLGINTRLDRAGKIQFYFWMGVQNSEGLLVVSKSVLDKALEEFNKFIIMDDVNLEVVDKSFEIVLGPSELKGDCEIEFAGEKGQIFFEDQDIEKISKNDLEEFCRLQGWPWEQSDVIGKTVNETFLNNIAVSYDKGCFLGQETAAKIETRRGAGFFPVILNSQEKFDLGPISLDDKKIGEVEYVAGKRVIASLLRDFRVEGRILSIEGKEVIVRTLPTFKEKNNPEKAQALYHAGIELFQKDNEIEGRELLERAIEIDPQYADAYESLGVMFGRHDQYQKAIELMDKLLKVNPDSVMAHTNKSLYLMKLGKIEEAEEEKSLASVKSFSLFGKMADEEIILKEAKIKEESEILRREEMFKQVLEIDSEDEVANYGMGDIALKRNLYPDAVTYLKITLDTNKKHSRAYLLLGKAYAAMGKISAAKEAWEMGITVASKQGDMMPANEMQALVVKL